MEKSDRVISVDQSLRELSPHGTVALPLQVNHDRLSAFRFGHVGCHWHEEIEFSLVMKGTARYVLGNGARLLSAGEGILINANVPHAVFPGGKEEVEMLVLIVHPAFIYGFPGSAIESQLLRPFLAAKSLAAVPLEAEELRACREIARQEAERPFGWTLLCKEKLCHVLYALLLRYRDLLSGGGSPTGEELRRLETLLAALNARYDEPLSLDAMARLAGLSRAGCCRFFKRMTGQTLSQYLEDYRVEQGMALLSRGETSVTDAALRCGFGNAGRFSAAFAKRMHCTPRAYLRGLRTEEK